ncbi:MAG: SDR family NAD(P)-dependent oxidoreductase, partial [Erythrobacter sp.]
ILCLAAAYLPELTPVSQMEPKQFNQALLTNLVANQALLSNFNAMLRRAEAGRVIGFTSSVARSPRAYWGAYSVTKAAFENLLETYSAEVERICAVRVAIIDPGATRTEMRARAFPGEDPQTVKPPEQVAARIVALLAEGFDGLHRERID